MTSPVNTTFTSGTTITSNWLNGANDHVNDLEPNAHVAANITNVPSGNITATNVQTAINELDSNKVTSGQLLNVLDFGATGDGVTNDTVAVQAALDAAWSLALSGNNTGVALYFPPGSYLCGALQYGSLTAPGVRPSRLYIYGEHAASIIESTVTTGQVALNFTMYTGMSNFGGNTIENMMFRSKNYQGNGLQFNATNWMTRVTGCIFQGFDYNYLNKSGITTTVQNCFFLSAQQYNFYLGVGSTGVAGYDEAPANLRFQNNYLGQGLDPVYGNIIYSQKGIGGTTAYGLGVYNAIITDNVFEGCIDYAIYVGESDGSTTSTNLLIDGNWFESPGYPTTKDQITGALKGSTVTNNFSSQALFTNYGSTFDFSYYNVMYNNTDEVSRGLSITKNYTGLSNTTGFALGGKDAGVGFTGIKVAYKNNVSLNDPSAYPFMILSNGVDTSYMNGIGQWTMIGSAGTEGQIYLRNDGTSAGKKWHIGANSGNAFVVYNQTPAGVYLNDGATSWSANSDERKKDIIEPIENALEKVSTLRSVIGKYKLDEEGTRRSFLIAQDVQAVLPEAVNVQPDEEGTLGLQYADVIPLLVAAIKELKAEIDILKSSK